MAFLDRFQVVLMPRREVLVTGLSLAEAVAYVGGYQEVNERGDNEAVIALAREPALAASGRSLRHQQPVQANQPAGLVRSA